MFARGALPRADRQLALLVALAVHCLVILTLARSAPSARGHGLNRLSSHGEGGQIEVDLQDDLRSPAASPPPLSPLHLEHRSVISDLSTREIADDLLSDSAAGVNDTSQAKGDRAALATGAVTTGSTDSDYGRELLEHIERNKRYPHTAAEGAPRGMVGIVFRLARNGSVLGVWVRTSSGSRALDKEAVDMVLRGQPLPPIPADLPDPMSFSFEIKFE